MSSSEKDDSGANTRFRQIAGKKRAEWLKDCPVIFEDPEENQRELRRACAEIQETAQAYPGYRTGVEADEDLRRLQKQRDEEWRMEVEARANVGAGAAAIGGVDWLTPEDVLRLREFLDLELNDAAEPAEEESEEPEEESAFEMFLASVLLLGLVFFAAIGVWATAEGWTQRKLYPEKVIQELGFELRSEGSSGGVCEPKEEGFWI